MSFDRPKHGWESINNGGEVYGTQANSQMSYQSNLEQEYKNTVKRLALNKMRNEIAFESFLNAAIRKLYSLGLEVDKNDMMRDIQKEINIQSIMLQMGDDFVMDVPNKSTNSEIDYLKSNLENIFGGKVNSSFEQPMQTSEFTPREPVTQSNDYYEELMAETQKMTQQCEELQEWSSGRMHR